MTAAGAALRAESNSKVKSEKCTFSARSRRRLANEESSPSPGGGYGLPRLKAGFYYLRLQHSAPGSCSLLVL